MTRKIPAIILLSFVVILLSTACKPKALYLTINGFVQGTTYQITYNDPKHRDLKPEIELLLSEFDSTMSIYNPSSMVSIINNSNQADTIRLNPWFIECFDLSQNISVATGGYFDVTVKPLTTAYGFAEVDGNNHAITDKTRDSLLQITGYELISISDSERIVRDMPGVQLDFNAIAKGYSVDLVARKLDELGVTDYIVEIGGEIFCRGVNHNGTDWNIGIDKPFEGNVIPGNDLQTVVALSGKGLATSGNYRKFKTNDAGQKVTHTINPITGESVTHTLLSATIIADNTATADAWATACMVGGLDWSTLTLANQPTLEAYLIYAGPNGEFRVFTTKNLNHRIKK